MTSPEVGASSPVSILTVVDFPAPLGPRKAQIAPGGHFQVESVHRGEVPEAARQIAARDHTSIVTGAAAAKRDVHSRLKVNGLLPENDQEIRHRLAKDVLAGEKRWHTKSDRRRAKRYYFDTTDYVEIDESEINGFLQWYTSDFRDGATGRTLVEHYVETHGGDLSPRARLLLEAWRNSWPGVLKTKPWRRAADSLARPDRRRHVFLRPRRYRVARVTPRRLHAQPHRGTRRRS